MASMSAFLADRRIWISSPSLDTPHLWVVFTNFRRVHLTAKKTLPSLPRFGNHFRALMLSLGHHPHAAQHQDSLRNVGESLQGRTASERYFIRMASTVFSVPRAKPCKSTSAPSIHTACSAICQRHRFSLLDQTVLPTYAAIMLPARTCCSCY